MLRKRVDFRHLPSRELYQKLDNHSRTKSCFPYSLPPPAPTQGVVREKLSKMQEKEHILNKEGNSKTILPAPLPTMLFL